MFFCCAANRKEKTSLLSGYYYIRGFPVELISNEYTKLEVSSEADKKEIFRQFDESKKNVSSVKNLYSDPKQALEGYCLDSTFDKTRFTKKIYPVFKVKIVESKKIQNNQTTIENMIVDTTYLMFKGIDNKIVEIDDSSYINRFFGKNIF